MKRPKSLASRLVNQTSKKPKSGVIRTKKPRTKKEAVPWLIAQIEQGGWHYLSAPVSHYTSKLHPPVAVDLCESIRQELKQSLIVWESNPNRTKQDVLNLLRRLQ